MPRKEQQAAFQEKLSGATEDIEAGKSSGYSGNLVKQKSGTSNDTMAKKVCVIKSKIQTVPPRLRNMQAYVKYYLPVVLPLGPVDQPHFDDNRLEEIRNLKSKLASHFREKNKVDEERLYMDIVSKIKDFRECYAANLNSFGDDELTSIFLVDGCAVMCLIQAFANSVDIPLDDLGKELKAMGITSNRITPILRDLFLLENQLPFSLLLLISLSSSDEEKLIKDIYRFVAVRVGVGPIGQEPAAGAETQPKNNYFSANHVLFSIACLPREGPAGEQTKPHEGPAGEETQPPEEPAKGKTSHLLDLYRDFLIFGSGKFHEPDVLHSYIKFLSSINASFWDFLHPCTFRNVTELKASGIGIKRSKTNSPTDISFDRGWFLGDVKLPLLILTADMASIYLNLLAYEMCPDFQNEREFTSYICFMDSLIDQPEDVAVLRKANILRNYFGSDEDVLKFFNEIRTDLEPNILLYFEVKRGIILVYESKYKVWIAQFLNDKFNSLFTVFAFVSAIIALALTFVQTWYDIHPKRW